MTKEQIIQNIKTRISTIESYHPEEYVLNKGILLELKDLLSMIEKDEPSLPSNLDEVALQWCDSVKFYSDLSGTPINAFKAGAKWMAEQGETKEGIVVDNNDYIDFEDNSFIDVRPTLYKKAFNLHDGEKVIVQIRKKEE